MSKEPLPTPLCKFLVTVPKLLIFTHIPICAAIPHFATRDFASIPLEQALLKKTFPIRPQPWDRTEAAKAV